MVENKLIDAVTIEKQFVGGSERQLKNDLSNSQLENN